MGSFYNFPISLATVTLRKKLFIHEGNSILGLANKVLGIFAEKIFLTFPLKNFPKKTILTGMPIRKEFFQKFEKSKLYKKYNFSNNKKTLLIIGGSQGAKFINNMILNHIEELRKFIQQIIHLTGYNEDNNNIKKYYDNNSIKSIVLKNSNKLIEFYSISDFIISRAGSSTLNELKLFSNNTLLIPYPHAKDNHQVLNAKLFVRENLFSEFFEENSINIEILKKFLSKKVNKKLSNIHYKKNDKIINLLTK